MRADEERIKQTTPEEGVTGKIVDEKWEDGGVVDSEGSTVSTQEE
jgi:hypothetical protein